MRKFIKNDKRSLYLHRHSPICENATLLDFLKDRSFGVDWRTECAECGFCHCVLKPPKWLVIYYRLEVWTPIPMLLMAVLGKGFPHKYWPFIVLVCGLLAFLSVRLLPAMIARFGTWERVDLNGKTLDDYYKTEIDRVIASRNTEKYYLLYFAGFFLMALLAFALHT